ncbi:hypothetical protein LZ30DRAFT_478623 [Colletotrichum cereale]|nr:hypothetical protein LZ30DRAFT_478623 [Colletotrichum cereale]
MSDPHLPLRIYPGIVHQFLPPQTSNGAAASARRSITITSSASSGLGLGVFACRSESARTTVVKMCPPGCRYAPHSLGGARRANRPRTCRFTLSTEASLKRTAHLRNLAGGRKARSLRIAILFLWSEVLGIEKRTGLSSGWSCQRSGPPGSRDSQNSSSPAGRAAKISRGAAKLERECHVEWTFTPRLRRGMPPFRSIDHPPAPITISPRALCSTCARWIEVDRVRVVEAERCNSPRGVSQ